MTEPYSTLTSKDKEGCRDTPVGRKGWGTQQFIATKQNRRLCIPARVLEFTFSDATEKKEFIFLIFDVAYSQRGEGKREERSKDRPGL